MAYVPVIIDASDYLDIRTALGLSATDTTTLPDATIEGRAYLPFVERMVKAKFTTYAAILTAAGDKAETLRDGVVMWAAARLAQWWLAAKAGDEVQRIGVGPYSTQYRAGPDWLALARELAQAAAAAFEKVEVWGESPQRITVASRQGPTRKHESDETQMSLFDWQELLQPPMVKGHMYDDEDDL